MPRNVRNFWIETAIDGREFIGAGPPSKDGGFELTIKQRHLGQPEKALTVEGRVENSKLVLRVGDRTGKVIHKNETLK